MSSSNRQSPVPNQVQLYNPQQQGSIAVVQHPSSQHVIQTPGVPLSRSKQQVKVMEVECVRIEGTIQKDNSITVGNVERFRETRTTDETLIQKYPQQVDNSLQQPTRSLAITDGNPQAFGSPANETESTDQQIQLRDAPGTLVQSTSQDDQGNVQYRHEETHTEMTEDSIHTKTAITERMADKTSMQYTPTEAESIQIQYQQLLQAMNSHDEQQIDSYNLTPPQPMIQHATSKEVAVVTAVPRLDPNVSRKNGSEQFSEMHHNRQERSVTKMDGKSEQRYVQSLRIEQAEDGTVRFIHEQWILRTYDKIIDTLVYEAEQETPIYQPSCFDKCITCCCQAYSCGDCKSIFSTQKKTITKLLDMPETLRKARSIGIKGMTKAVSNIFTETPLGYITREIFVLVQFIAAVVSFVTIGIQYTIDQLKDDDKEDDQFLLASLVINIVIMFFTCIDFIYNLCYHPCRIVKEIKKYRARKKERSSKYQFDKDRETQEEQAIDPNQCCQRICKCCRNSVTAKLDLVRIILAAILFYPELFLSVLKFSTEYVDKGDDASNISILTWLRQISSFSQTAFNIYISRAFI